MTADERRFLDIAHVTSADELVAIVAKTGLSAEKIEELVEILQE